MAVDESIVILKRQRYLQALYQFGIFTLCFMISEYELEENYEECQIILSVIHHHQATIDEEMPTRFDSETRKYLIDTIKTFNLNQNNVFNNLHRFAKETKLMVNKDLTA
jgi:hypothetical protein